MITRPGVIRNVGVLDSPAPVGPAKNDCSSLIAGVCILVGMCQGYTDGGFVLSNDDYSIHRWDLAMKDEGYSDRIGWILYMSYQCH